MGITMRLDVECPTKCGECCRFCELDAHTPQGCSFPRSDRPIECLAYMCGEATMIYNGDPN